MRRHVLPGSLLVAVVLVLGCDADAPNGGEVSSMDSGGALVAVADVFSSAPAPACEEGAADDCPVPLRCVAGACLFEPPACGTPPPDADCHAELERDACVAHGGRFTAPMETNSETGFCLCPSGDEGCPCWKAAHCQGRCEGGGNCEATRVGTCSADRETMLDGCFCVADPFDGEAHFDRLCQN